MSREIIIATAPAIGAVAAASAAADGSASKHAANVFWTDRSGNGAYYAKLDYRLVKGAFQFQEFDSSLARNAIGDGPLGPVAYGVRLRLASHYVDQLAHGLVPGKHEMWFDWK